MSSVINPTQRHVTSFPVLFASYPKVQYECGCYFEEQKRFLRKTVIKAKPHSLSCPIFLALVETARIWGWKIEQINEKETE